MLYDSSHTEPNRGVGATSELSLRVSIACLARVAFMHPDTGERMLALEHTATLIEDQGERHVRVRVHPFGGACRLSMPKALRDVIGDFHFDSLRSQSERDFRILIRPSDWIAVKEFCLQRFKYMNDMALESNPNRELVEEFDDALHIKLKRDQYLLRPTHIIVEREPRPTENIHASGHPSVRIYRVFEAIIVDPSLVTAILQNSDQHSAERLEQLAWEDLRQGGKGRADAVRALSMQSVHEAYANRSPEMRHLPVVIGTDHFHGNTAALLEDLPVPFYERV